MTFSGLNKKTDIPSKAFQKLTRISNQDDDDQYNGQQQSNAYDKYREDGRFEINILMHFKQNYSDLLPIVMSDLQQLITS